MSPALPVRAAPARPLPVRAQAGVLAALTALVVLLTGLLVPAAPASAQTRSQTTSQTPSQAHSQTKAQTTADLPLQVVLDSLTPPVPRPKGRLAVTGHVVNAGNATVKNVSVRLRLSRVKVVSRGDLAALAAGRSVRDGSPIGLPGTSADVGDLVPGASAPFTLTVALDDLRLGTLGVFPLSVEARGVRAGGQDGGSLRRLGITRTFLPWAPDPLEAVPTRLAWVWPLADVPHRRVDGVFVDDALAASLAPGGRLEGLVQGATGRPVTWLVDPMLLDDARAMSQGYRVAASSGGGSAAGGSPGQGGQAAPAPEQGTGGTAARAFLSDLVAATGTADVVALPFGDPDVRALLAAGQVSVLPAAVARGRATATDVLGRPVPSAVAAPPGGFASQAELEALRAAGSDAVLLDGRALPSTSPGTPTGRATVTVGGAAEPVALWDPTLSQLVSTAPSGPGGELLARQRFLAETEMVTAESPGVQRTVVIAPPHDWDVDPQRAAQLLSLTASAPWLTLVTLSEALAVPPPDVDRGPLVTAPPPPAGDDEGAGPGDPARATPLPTDYVRAVGTTVARGQSAAAVLQDPTPVRTSYQVEGERLVSAALRSDLRRGRALLEQTRSALAARIDAVRILPASATLGSSAADIPVTVVNDLDQPVTVKVAFFSGSPRLTVRPPGPVTVAPGSKARVLVPVTARANGVVDVSARLLTPAGDPLGDAVAVRVRIAQYGPAGVLVTAGAALLLFLGAAHNIYRRVRGRRAPSEQAAGAAAPSQPPAAGDQAAVEDGAAPAPESSGAQRPGTGDGAGSPHPLPGPR